MHSKHSLSFTLSLALRVDLWVILRPAALSSEVAWGSSVVCVSCTRKALEPFEPYSHSATAQEETRGSNGGSRVQG
jgi:hypothetical protein